MLAPDKVSGPLVCKAPLPERVPAITLAAMADHCCEAPRATFPVMAMVLPVRLAPKEWVPVPPLLVMTTPRLELNVEPAPVVTAPASTRVPPVSLAESVSAPSVVMLAPPLSVMLLPACRVSAPVAATPAK